MSAAIDRNRLKPVADRRFAFNAVPEALRLMQAGAISARLSSSFLEVVTAGIGRPDRFCYRLPASSGNGIDNA